MAKVAIVLFTFFISGVVFAEDSSSPFEDNVINALHYRSAAHAFYTSLALATPIVRTDDVWAGSGQTNHYSTSGLTATLTFNYGITDAIEVGFSENYLISSKTTDDFVGGSDSYSSQGASNPTLMFSYRFGGKLTGREFGSIYVDVTPAIGKQENGTPLQSGNNLNADNIVTAGLNWYCVNGMQEHLINPYVVYRTSGTYNNSTNSYTNNPYAFIGLELNYRYHVNEQFAVTAGLDVQAPFEVTYNNSNPSNTQTNSDGPEVIATFSANYKFSSSWLLAGTLSDSYSDVLSTFNDGTNNISSQYQTINFTLTGVHTY